MHPYKIADLTVELEYSGQTLLKQAKPYQIDTGSTADIRIVISGEQLKKGKEKYPNLTLNEWEYIQTGFAFSRALLEFDGFCLHASAVAVDNKAVLFSAPCGTGKSTHASLWQKHFGEGRAVILNDDKPALRLIDDRFYVYGTPWSGKSDLNANLKVPLQAIVFLGQAQENHIQRLNNKEAVQMLIFQSLRPNNDRAKMGKLLILLDALLKRNPIYQMGCNISIDAVKLVYHTINNETKG